MGVREECRLRVIESGVLRVIENGVLRVIENGVLRVIENVLLRVIENGVLRRVFGPRRDKVTDEWRKLKNKQLNDFYSSPNNIQAIKSRVTWVEHVARGGEEMCIQNFSG
jgi:hypothetical protein